MSAEQIQRINELYRKSVSETGLTLEEAEEQKKLRDLYIKSVRENLRGQLNNIDIRNEDGTITPLGKR
ncbi:MAG: DUF896 domain-containing protein [Clostridiales bacterium]|nr:DUF896 domain-containing protein [Clostridiales bacterium]MDO5141148.1 DUF896 domain-containing protein [Eubacteriales bacterium]